jgi:TAG lipase / steryl ester hydrolase / phospholipase A2 / LPA acyltransferase
MLLTSARRAALNPMNAETYADWAEKAKAYDARMGAERWREKDETDLYDYKSIARRLAALQAFRAAGDDKALLYALNEGIHGNMDGMGNESLYQEARFGTKKLVEAYVAEIAGALDHLASPAVTSVSLADKRDFFNRAQHCYGRSALMLSGSGSFLYFHIGVVKTLWQEGILPDVISGSSGGSIVGAILGTHLDDDLAQLFDPAWLDAQVVAADFAANTGKQLSSAQVREQIALLIPDLTFQEAYALTGRHLNVSVAPAERHQNSRLLNAIASPNVMIREAVLASCAVPGIFDAVALMAKDHEGNRVPYLADRRWVDGSVTNDLPAKRLARLYGVNHYIVSQANPHVTPFISDLKQPNSVVQSVRQAAVATTKAWMNANMSIWEKPLSYFPALNGIANMTMSVIDQDYGGDITIVNPPRLWSPAKMLSQLSLEDMTDLIATGEATSWPKIEMIRTQTQISRTLARAIHELA